MFVCVWVGVLGKYLAIHLQKVYISLFITTNYSCLSLYQTYPILSSNYSLSLILS